MNAREAAAAAVAFQVSLYPDHPITNEFVLEAVDIAISEWWNDTHEQDMGRGGKYTQLIIRLIRKAQGLEDSIPLHEMVKLMDLIKLCREKMLADARAERERRLEEIRARHRKSDDLFQQCIERGADRAAVAGWPDFKREAFIRGEFVV